MKEYRVDKVPDDELFGFEITNDEYGRATLGKRIEMLRALGAYDQFIYMQIQAMSVWSERELRVVEYQVMPEPEYLDMSRFKLEWIGPGAHEAEAEEIVGNFSRVLLQRDPDWKLVLVTLDDGGDLLLDYARVASGVRFRVRMLSLHNGLRYLQRIVFASNSGKNEDGVRGVRHILNSTLNDGGNGVATELLVEYC